MKFRTFNTWSKKGYKILKGSKALGFSEDGEALFSSNQVEKAVRPNYTTELYRNEADTRGQSRTEADDEWHSNRGDVNYGGIWVNPNDPLSDLADSYNSDETGWGW